MTPSRRLAAACGVLAPASFIGAWAICGALRDDGYDPVQDAISQLARIGSPTRAGMTAGFLGFGLLLPVFARRLPDLLDAGRAVRVAATVAGVSTVAVAALPLQQKAGGPRDALHAVAAGVGYAAMATTPLLAAAALRRTGRTGAAAVSAGVGVVSATALVVSVTTGPTGLWQRIGLGVVDVWFAAWAVRSLAVIDDNVQV